MLSQQNELLISDLETLKIWLNHIKIAPRDTIEIVDRAVKTIKTLGHIDEDERDFKFDCEIA